MTVSPPYMDESLIRIKILAFKKCHFHLFCLSFQEFEYPKLVMVIAVLVTVNAKKC